MHKNKVVNEWKIKIEKEGTLRDGCFAVAHLQNIAKKDQIAKDE